MADRKTVMSWLEGLTQDDWQPFHSDSEVQQIAMAALALLKEQDNMISIKVVSAFLAEYALPPTLQKQNLFSLNGNMASEWEQFLRDLKGR